jgi:hypothetical protein
MSSTLLNGWSNVWGLESYGHSLLSWASIIALLYVPLCAMIRRQQIRRTIGRQESRELETVTLEEAYSIKTRLAEHEFPLVFSATMASIFFRVT